MWNPAAEVPAPPTAAIFVSCRIHPSVNDFVDEHTPFSNKKASEISGNPYQLPNSAS